MAGISSKAAGGIENKKKYNGYEFNSDFDINLYESFFRSHDPQIGRFWQIDPKPNYSDGLYAAMGDNPIKNFDILGDVYKTEKDKKLYEETTKSIDGKVKELQASLDKLEKASDEKLSKRKKEKRLNEIEDYRERIENLEKSKNDLNEFDKDQKNTYTFTMLSSFDKEGSVLFEKDGTVNIRYLPGGVEFILHEVDHANDYRVGLTKISGELPTTGYSSKTSIYEIEASAYRKQFAYKNSGLPESSAIANVLYIFQITAKFIEGMSFYQDVHDGKH